MEQYIAQQYSTKIQVKSGSKELSLSLIGLYLEDVFIFFIFQFLDDILRDRELDIVLDRVLDGEGVSLVESLVQRPHHRLGRHLAPTEGGEEGESGEECPSLHVMSTPGSCLSHTAGCGGRDRESPAADKHHAMSGDWLSVIARPVQTFRPVLFVISLPTCNFSVKNCHEVRNEQLIFVKYF